MLRESWWMKQLAVLIGLQAGGLALGLFLHSTAVSDGQLPLAGNTGQPVSAGDLPAGAATVTTFAWVAAVQAIICYLVFGRLYHRMREHSAQMESVFRRQDDDLSRTREAIVVGMTHLAESRDGDGDGHHDRVGRLSELLARAAAQRPEFADQITPEFIRCIRVSAMLHDIGKVGIQDAVLLKPGRLTVQERRQMEQHTRISSECLARVESCLGDANFLEMAHRIALFHHERWDGTGYPASLYGDKIPLEARITAIADVYDALSSQRAYKKAYPHEVCIRLICESTGTQFDPRLIEVFLSIADQFESISSAPVEAAVQSASPTAASRVTTQQPASTSETVDPSGNTVDLSGETVDMAADVLELCLANTDRDAQPGTSNESSHSSKATNSASR